jgi:hypothetical protein
MVTDMHRLERAARLSLGDFESASQDTPPSRRLRLSPRLAMPLLVLAFLVVAALFLG